jgi:UDP-N-acetylglucosamine:LPS N-acetylglucosamine transferase
VCVGASSGGHTNELFALLGESDLWPAQPSVCVTTLEILRSQFEPIGPTYVVGECHRKRPLAAVGVLWRAFSVARKERPDVLITTGSLPLAMVAGFVKLFGGKVVWIDSVAQLSKMSMSGRVVRRFADLCLVQWPAVAEHDDRVEYAGALL